MLLPILSVQGADDIVAVPDESLSWSKSLIEKDVPTTEIRRRLNAVGRLFEFSQAVLGERIAEPGAMDLVVWEYLRARVENPKDPSKRVFQHWQPVQYETARSEYRDIVDFARYCADYTGPTSVIGAAFQSTSDIWTKAERHPSESDLLAHLEAQRARWHALLGDDRPAPPSSLRRLALSSTEDKSANSTSLSSEEIDCIIDREKNVVFRALWILLAFLGPRISEALNLWRCDILDGSYAPQLFNAQVKGPLILFADPRHSLSTGSFDRRQSVQTRSEHLHARYGLKPRPDAEGKKQRAGWKGMSVFNPHFRLTHGTWTCLRRASEFADLATDIQKISADCSNDGLHPYFFVNGKNAEYFGEPLKLGNVEKAFDRALVRSGIEPHSPGAHLHGLRHYYRWYAKHELKLDDETVQLMLRQRSLDSQRVYGKRASDLNDAMSTLQGTEE
ncbi:integrase [Aminobacter niigataensis]|uniref:Integrase n=1 Tax=Aminobacter niigataensis TaxID=83265 RepID=A0ABR6L1D3_9HYPH|nr:hypothetical protein [Aminobacter niigataensis]MBB4650576.1 integrase [Aminobacter niigataensis]